MNMFGVPLTQAKKNMFKRGLIAMAVYFVAIEGAWHWVAYAHPEGAMIWVAAALPVLPIVAVILIMGQYLREETDEFHRHMVTRCLLWGAAAMMTAVILQLFVQAYGWKGQWPPMADLLVFAVAMAVAKVSYRISGRVPSHD